MEKDMICPECESECLTEMDHFFICEGCGSRIPKEGKDE